MVVCRWSFAFPVFMVAVQYWQLNRAYRRTPWLNGPVEGELLNDGLIIRYPNATSDIKWQHFTKARRTRDAFLLYQSPHTFNLVPRDLFESEAAWQRALALVQTRLGAERSWHDLLS